MTGYKILGTNSDHDTCSHCGKTGLKKVVWMARIGSDGTCGDAEPMGCNCAATLMRIPSCRAWRKAEDADQAKAKAELTKISEVGPERGVRTIVIESIGNNGGSITLLGYANGLMSAVQKWAADRWPNRELNVRWIR